MRETDLDQFKDQQFLSLETFRKTGIGVKTPVWFVREGDALYIWTLGDSGKIKRIRNNPDVKVAPCGRFGKIKGGWIAARASIDDSVEAVRHVEGLLRRKLGFQFAAFRLVERLRDRGKGSRRVCLRCR